MFKINRLAIALAAFALVFSSSEPVLAGSRKAQKLIDQGRAAEDKKDYDKALELYERAVMESPRDSAALLSLRRVRFQAGQAHVDKGQKLRADGKLEEALTEFQKAYAIDPASGIAEQELRRTRQMLDREKREGEKLKGEERGMTPVERARKEIEDRVASVLPAPELKPLSSAPITLTMRNQPAKVLFETVGKLAGINVIMDPDPASAMGGPQRNMSVEFSNASLEEALDYLAVMTKSFWKPLSANTILVAQDNPTKRRDFEDLVVKVFYLTNTTAAQDLNEIAAAVRGITDIRRLYTCGAQNAIIIRGTVDQVALAEKLIQDMDKPKSEVVVEVVVMEASRSKTRDLASTIMSGTTAGLSSAISFTPRNGTTTDTTSDDSTTTTSTTMSLARLGKLSTGDFSVTMPGGLIKALMTDSRTRILQQPQVRAADGQKASLRIGEKTPIASGSFSSGMSTATGLLASTQFQFVDVGVNVDIQPKIHGPDEVSLHIELEISSVKERIEIGGVSQPVIGQRKVVHDIRIRDGEVNVLGGLMQGSQTRSTAGLPGLASIPGLKWFFTSRSNTDGDSELLIALIPHIVRAPDISDVNLKGVAAGTDQSIKLNYAPRKTTAPAEPAKPTAPPQAAQPQLKPPPEPMLSPTGTVLPLPVNAGPPKLSFTPAAAQVQMGATVMVRLEIANGVDMFAAPFKLKYDPKVLRLKEVTDGGIIGGDGRKPIFARNIRNDVGEAAVILNRLPGAGGVSGTGSLAMLEFQVVGRGPAKIALQEIGLKDSKMQPITVALPEVVLDAR